MIFIFFSVFFTALVFLILKEFQRFKIDNLQGIVVSYFVALFIGFVYSDSTLSYDYLIHKNWIWGAVCISIIFITVFNLMAITAQKGGLSVMSVANKMSVVIPIGLGVLLYKENIGFLKVTGIVLALLGVWLTSKKEGKEKFEKRFWYLPLFIFIGSGLADSIMNHMQIFWVPQKELDVFSTSLFLFCGAIGIVVCLIKLMLGKLKPSLYSFIGGLVLGVPNYFSIYFLLKALSQPNYESSLVFSVNNVSIVLVSVLLGVLLYQEKLSKQNYLGIGLSVLSIIVLYFAI